MACPYSKIVDVEMCGTNQQIQFIFILRSWWCLLISSIHFASEWWMKAVILSIMLDQTEDKGKDHTYVMPCGNGILMYFFHICLSRTTGKSVHNSQPCVSFWTSTYSLKGFSQQKTKIFYIMNSAKCLPTLLSLFYRWLPWVRSHKLPAASLIFA